MSLPEAHAAWIAAVQNVAVAEAELARVRAEAEAELAPLRPVARLVSWCPSAAVVASYEARVEAAEAAVARLRGGAGPAARRRAHKRAQVLFDARRWLNANRAAHNNPNAVRTRAAAAALAEAEARHTPILVAAEAAVTAARLCEADAALNRTIARAEYRAAAEIRHRIRHHSAKTRAGRKLEDKVLRWAAS